MPIYNGMLPAIDKAEVKRYAGLRHAEDFPQQYVDEACKEIQLLADKGIKAVSLGNQRLRTETAGIFVAAWNYDKML